MQVLCTDYGMGRMNYGQTREVKQNYGGHDWGINISTYYKSNDSYNYRRTFATILVNDYCYSTFVIVSIAIVSTI